MFLVTVRTVADVRMERRRLPLQYCGCVRVADHAIRVFNSVAGRVTGSTIIPEESVGFGKWSRIYQCTENHRIVTHQSGEGECRDQNKHGSNQYFF